ncbi:HET domain-containing protein [Colletotrichum plurivorum]|uniref:HET domain-containing protein n=1 Tax=Colletotrichum plurivorum TaxID=2175906 RepID=A0A8H6NGU4_9PEZI|nr:HET domain-containing protein [Colletotrichum plurivorum]
MKLLNSTTLKIEEFFGSAIPKSYVILSHRWEDGEATYQEVGDERAMSQKSGWAKIRKTCSIARDRGIDYVWVDTCCINKQDFSELTEAINSMFKWYVNATVCLAYLSDVDGDHPFERSRWFERGWTLQELIAPNRVEFFDGTWNAIGTCQELSDVIHRRTHIDESILRSRWKFDVLGSGIRKHLNEFPVAVRMSWAVGRETTRVEDRAYSLMGLFNVNMPLLYGEGDRAFVRLQEEIIKESNDMTLFAWTGSTGALDYTTYEGTKGIFATSPDAFGFRTPLEFTRIPKLNPEVRFSLTNKGLKISMEAVTPTNVDFPGSSERLQLEKLQLLPLGCRWSGNASGPELGILLHDGGDGTWLRARATQLFEIRRDTQRTIASFFIQKYRDRNLENKRSMIAEHPDEFRFRLAGSEIELVRALPAERWSLQENRFLTKGLDVFTGFTEVRDCRQRGGGGSLVVACGFGPLDEYWHCRASEGSQEYMYEAAMAGRLAEVDSVHWAYRNPPDQRLPGRLEVVECRVGLGHRPKYAVDFVVKEKILALR